jgi:hypothetical protein
MAELSIWAVKSHTTGHSSHLRLYAQVAASPEGSAWMRLEVISSGWVMDEI